MDGPQRVHLASLRRPSGEHVQPDSQHSLVGSIALSLTIGAIIIVGAISWLAIANLSRSVADASASLTTLRGRLAPSAASAPLEVRSSLLAGTPLPRTLEPTTPTAVPQLAPLEPLAVSATSPAITAEPTIQMSVPATKAAVPTLAPIALATAEPIAAPQPSARAPWVMLPKPDPASTVKAGAVLIEARGRGDAPIASMEFAVDGAAQAAALDQRSETIWRGQTTVAVAPGQHTVVVTVLDSQGRKGGYHWTFSASP